jgi:excinuclease ABC subunit C
MSFDRASIDTFPAQPGVYLMKGRDGTVLYVGKANNLRQRVRQYFFGGSDTREMIPFLVAKVESIDTIVVFSEKEAFLLENNLIKKHKPRYNALLKDDKSYIALKVNNKHSWPMVSLVRYRGNPKPDGLYFGPYTSAESARTTLDLLHRLFPLRQCSDQELLRRTRPCILYDMKRCIAPCVNKCTKEEYDHLVNRTVKFLRGQDKEVLSDLHKEMTQASESLEFEKAASIYQTIRHIEKTLEGQSVDRPLGIDADALGIYRQGDQVMLVLLNFRDGKLMGSRNFSFEGILEEDSELISSFVLQNYQGHDDIPKEILVPVALEGNEALEEILSQGRGKVELVVPKRGDKREYIDMAATNAEAAFKKEKDEDELRGKILMEMQEKLHLSRCPMKIECFDNSNLSGSLLVSSLVSFVDGKKNTSGYRRYKIKTASGSDDYGAMKEVLFRRYSKVKSEEELPDLILIDGGKGHLNLARKILEELNIISVDVVGIAKEQGRHDKGSTLEQIFLPDVKDPILLKRHSSILFFIQKIRDEAHRFAITYNKMLRSKLVRTSVLDDIPGIGPIKRKALLMHFGSLKKLKEATEETLKDLSILSEKDRQAILEFMDSNNGQQP